MHMETLTSYAAAARFFSTCRSPKAGKPLPGRWRMFKEGKVYTICISQYGGWDKVGMKSLPMTYEPLCTISPNNKLAFVMPLEKMLGSSNSIVILLQKIVPITIERVSKGKYKVGAYTTNVSPWGHSYSKMDLDGTEYFKGLKFNLPTGECLNPRPDEVRTLNPEVRTQWLRDLKRYKRGLKARAKVGALQGYVAQYMADLETADNYWQYLQRTAPRWGQDAALVKRVIRCVKAEKYPEDVLMAFVKSAFDYRRKAVADKDILSHVDTVFNMHSTLFRKEYGVFGKTLHAKS